jgi:REP element-mobilizing transposase RayT
LQSLFDWGAKARIGRIVVLGFPYYVTQRGNGRQQVFFELSDDTAGVLGND